MPLEIHIKTEYGDPRTAAEQLDEAMAALGFVRKSSAVSLILGSDNIVNTVRATAGSDYAEPDEEGRGRGTAPKGEPDTRGMMNVGLEHAEAPARGPDPDYTHPSGRKFGEAGEGRKRRTKVEMAEDTAYLASLDMQTEAVEQEEIPIDDADPQAAFAAASEDVETVAQDAADEAAEAATEQSGALTLEDLRRTIGDYAKKHGIPKAQANVPGILGAPMLEVTDFETAIARVRLATATSDGLLHESDVTPRATKDDLLEAIQAYTDRYEGKGVQAVAGGLTAVDLGKVMREAFPGTSGALSEIPATPEGYGKALGAVNAAITGNPFQREVK